MVLTPAGLVLAEWDQYVVRDAHGELNRYSPDGFREQFESNDVSDE